MKKLSLLLLSNLLFIAVTAQENTDSSKLTLIFDEFSKGKIINKNGTTSSGMFNYDTEEEVLLFLGDNSEPLKLANPNAVAIVTIGTNTFQHIKNGLLYQEVKVGDDFLYIRWKTKNLKLGKTGLYGTTSTSGALSSYSMNETRGKMLELEEKENVQISLNNSYYLKLNNKYKRFVSFNALADLFKPQKDQILEFVKTENLDFKKIDDIKKAVEYANSVKN